MGSDARRKAEVGVSKACPWGIPHPDGIDCVYCERAALRAENERLRAAATEALAVLTRLADSAAYWSDYDVPVGIVAEIDAAKARLAGVLNG